jgi:hypothetical protein
MCVDPCPCHLEDVGERSTTVHLKGDTPLVHCGLAGNEFEPNSFVSTDTVLPPAGLGGRIRWLRYRIQGVLFRTSSPRSAASFLLRSHASGLQPALGANVRTR